MKLSQKIEYSMPVVQFDVNANFCNSQHIYIPKSLNKFITPEMIPRGVKSIKFNDDYNKPIAENIIPQTVENIIFGYEYNQPIGYNTLPISLTKIKFGERFSQSLVDSLPAELSTIYFSASYNYIIYRRTFPSGVKKIVFTNQLDYPQFFHSGLREIYFNGKCTNIITRETLPSTLETIIFTDCHWGNIHSDAIPLSVQTFEYAVSANNIQKIKSFYNRITTLYICDYNYRSPRNIDIDINDAKILLDIKVIKISQIVLQSMIDILIRCFNTDTEYWLYSKYDFDSNDYTKDYGTYTICKKIEKKDGFYCKIIFNKSESEIHSDVVKQLQVLLLNNSNKKILQKNVKLQECNTKLKLDCEQLCSDYYYMMKNNSDIVGQLQSEILLLNENIAAEENNNEIMQENMRLMNSELAIKYDIIEQLRDENDELTKENDDLGIMHRLKIAKLQNENSELKSKLELNDDKNYKIILLENKIKEIYSALNIEKY